jgi:hypothetical protein
MKKNHSFWQHKYGNYKANNALPKGQYEVDVLIVGAGFTGLTAAREIMRDTPEKKVMVVNANFDMVPKIGFIEDENIIYSSGCIEHGVSLTQLNGQLIADLILSIDSDISKFWIVNRKALPLPSGNFLPYMVVKVLTGMLKSVDGYEERELKSPVPSPHEPTI